MESVRALYDRSDQNNRDWLRSWGCVVIQLPEAAICINQSSQDYNGIFGINTTKEKAKELILSLVKRIKRGNGWEALTPVHVWLDMYCLPSELPVMLKRRGFRETSISYTMHIKTAERLAVQRSTLDVQRVDAISTLVYPSWVNVYSRAFDLDIESEYKRWQLPFHKESPVEFFLGEDYSQTDFRGRSGEPVCCGQLITTNNIAGLYSIGTVPEERRNGFASSMTAFLVEVARSRGLEDAYLIAQNQRNRAFYEKLGFKEVFRTYVYKSK